MRQEDRLGRSGAPATVARRTSSAGESPGICRRGERGGGETPTLAFRRNSTRSRKAGNDVRIPIDAIPEATPEELHGFAAELESRALHIRTRATGARHLKLIEKAESDAESLRRLAEDRRQIRASGPQQRDHSRHVAPPPAHKGIVWWQSEQVSEHLSIDRGTLAEMLAEAPPTLPGAPTQVGLGRRRRHWRWDASRVDEWFEAFGEWRRSLERRRASPRPARQRPKERPGPTKKRRPRSVLAMVKEEIEAEERGRS
jgi:hypothetical protein